MSENSESPQVGSCIDAVSSSLIRTVLQSPGGIVPPLDKLLAGKSGWPLFGCDEMIELDNEDGSSHYQSVTITQDQFNNSSFEELRYHYAITMATGSNGDNVKLEPAGGCVETNQDPVTRTKCDRSCQVDESFFVTPGQSPQQSDAEETDELARLRDEMEIARREHEKSQSELKMQIRELRRSLQVTENQKTTALECNAELGSDVISLEQKLETSTKVKNFAFSQLEKTKTEMAEKQRELNADRSKLFARCCFLEAKVRSLEASAMLMTSSAQRHEPAAAVQTSMSRESTVITASFTLGQRPSGNGRLYHEPYQPF